LLRGCNKIRQDWRVEFVCGGRAEAAARSDADLISQVSAHLKCAPQDLSASVERLLREREASAKRLKALLPKVAESDAAALLSAVSPRPGGIRVVAQMLEGVEPEYLQQLATALGKSENVVALLGDQLTGHIVFAQDPKAGKDMNALLKKTFEQFPGKGGGSKDFARGALSTPSSAKDLIKIAESLV
jgi:alanyl-tRNA synthetase